MIRDTSLLAEPILIYLLFSHYSFQITTYHSKWITPKFGIHFKPYFGSEKHAKIAFEMFDKDGNGDISKLELEDKIISIYKERKDLINCLRDTTQVIGELD